MANEKRLIDANALLKWLEEITDPKEWLVSQYNADWIWSMIDSHPTVDAVEVVRCEKCRWFDKSGYDEDNEHEEDLSLHMGWCAEWRRGTQACRFCSYGERKDNDSK